MLFIVCGRTSFYVFDKDLVVKTAGTKRNDTEVKDLVYKTYKWILSNREFLINSFFINHFIETGISIYQIETPKLHINLARCETYEEQLFEYINTKFKLFGYTYVTPQTAVNCV